MNGNLALVTTPSEIVATLLTLGTTCHHRFGPPYPKYHDTYSNTKLGSKETSTIKDVRMLMINVISMMDNNLLNLLDRFLHTLTLLTRTYDYMGGKLIMLMRDFQQTLPVITWGNIATIMSASVINSEGWPQLKTLSLICNMRVERLIQSDPSPDTDRATRLLVYGEWLLWSVGNATVLPVYQNIIEVPESMVWKSRLELGEKVYDNFLLN